MFQSRFLDRFTRVHPVLPVLIYGPVIVVAPARRRRQPRRLVGHRRPRPDRLPVDLFEYWLHRLVFHFEPEDGISAELHWMIHGVHHDHPNDPLRLVMPPAASIPLAIIVVGAIFLDRRLGARPAVAAGFLAGYLIYDEVHYALHHHVPKSRLGKRLRELHMRHHFQDDERGFGISAPYWDVVFRTYPERR